MDAKQQEGLDEEEEREDLRCGYGPWRPECLQRFDNAKALLAAVCCFTFVQGWVVTGINNINTSTLERRFDLRSSQIAWITSANEISGGVMGIVMGYLSGFHHKGKMMSVGAAMLSLGSIIMFLPHMFVGNYILGTTNQDQCTTELDCDLESSASYYLYVFIAGQVFHGIGGVAVFNVGLTYLDDNIRSKDTPLFVGIMHCFAAVGPACAFVAGGAMLNIHVDVGRVDRNEVLLTPKDPGWVGAWWIGYLISAFGGAMVSVILACFPRELPATKHIRSQEESQAYKGAGVNEMTRSNFGRTWSDAKLAFKVVITNPTWVLVTVGATVEVAGVNAFATFLPKILQFQFNLTPGTAALYAGGLVITGAAGGHLLGGIIPRCFNSRLPSLLIQMLAYSLTGLVLSAVFLIRCSMPDIAGVNVEYFNTSSQLAHEEVVHPCNTKCSCTTRSYEPLCGHDDVLYFSPCHAGCDNKTTLPSGEEVYTNCSCIQLLDNSSLSSSSWSLSSSSSSLESPWMARGGLCEQSCHVYLIAFLSVFLIAMLATFMTNTVGHAATMRCVPDKQKGFAYGIQAAVCRFVGISSIAFFLARMLYVPPTDDVIAETIVMDDVTDKVLNGEANGHIVQNTPLLRIKDEHDNNYHGDVRT